MVHLFNRAELITVFSSQRLYGLQSALSEARIPYHTKCNSGSVFTADRYRGMPCIDQDATRPCVIYVKRPDLDRARRVIQPLL